MHSKSGFTLELVQKIISLVPDLGCDKVTQKIREYHLDYYLLQKQRYYEHCIQYQNFKKNSQSFFSSNNYIIKIILGHGIQINAVQIDSLLIQFFLIQ